MNRGEFLQALHLPEPPHGPFPPSEFQVGILGSVVCPPTGFLQPGSAAATIAGIETARMIRIGQFGVSGITAFQQFAEFAA